MQMTDQKELAEYIGNILRQVQGRYKKQELNCEQIS